MLPKLSYPAMLTIHKALHTGATHVMGATVDEHSSATKKYNRVTVEDTAGTVFTFITQNMRKRSSPHTRRVLEALAKGERIDITWITSGDPAKRAYFGAIESHLTKTKQEIVIEDFTTNQKVYEQHQNRP